ncbi:tetrathionate reductase family octaheme c-type cytochrome [Magnetospirillum sulfuroxidans]|uniref:Tetrathionate reductase family octaheme c-type cytochrome n=1 Tax=Magnetospirillum sulfuroxidans TaxID=611300 RepID=A0ABS5ID49_9PROT|nr:tetrathionate reductase family octaheme c-type cytochrome [Magnetospirillum sulfuroxidans]MBR9972352.1 tetrathionate reductase family octaheme c-type cytochrome [Magnetospirillum sulfuroxidans]
MKRPGLRFGRWLRPLILAALMPALAQAASTADHSKFESLKGPFSSAPEVTKACLACHTEASHQVMKSIHWTWDITNPATGQRLGKARTMNSFCGSPVSNEPRCTSCHAGYGWTDTRQPPAPVAENVDCLVCHDRSGGYSKVPTDAGHPLYEPRMMKGKLVSPPDLAKVAQSVGDPGRDNCGACHFNGGGGDGVKHGDLDSSLSKPAKSLDVHMAADGADMTCATCHTFNDHIPSGSRYAPTAMDSHGKDLPKDDHNRATCESCHGDVPHHQAKLNDHTDRVACQTCHIPEFARGGVATKTWWDWSTAGRKDENGKPLFVKDDHGHLKYSAEKGDFDYGENVRPTYKWFNGTIDQTNSGDTFDDSSILVLNRLHGDAADPKARIWPFKEMKGKQPYDPELKTLLVNHVFGPDDSAFWTNFDINKSIKFGMDYAGLPWSGKIDFIETRMYWPITHMVAPKEQAVKCGECHMKGEDGRLAQVPGFYMPGRDAVRWLDLLGYLALGGALAGVMLHGLLRFVLRGKTRHD